jgi:hypothetical protein
MNTVVYASTHQHINTNTSTSAHQHSHQHSQHINTVGHQHSHQQINTAINTSNSEEWFWSPFETLIKFHLKSILFESVPEITFLNGFLVRLEDCSDFVRKCSNALLNKLLNAFVKNILEQRTTPTHHYCTQSSTYQHMDTSPPQHTTYANGYTTKQHIRPFFRVWSPGKQSKHSSSSSLSWK